MRHRKARIRVKFFVVGRVLKFRWVGAQTRVKTRSFVLGFFIYPDTFTYKQISQ